MQAPSGAPAPQHGRRPGPFSDRSKAREVAMQALYEVDASGHSARSSLAGRVDAWGLSEGAAGYAEELLEGVGARLGEIDALISQFAPSWPVDQLPSVERNVLRVAIFEIVSDGGTPPKVAANEAVELAKKFGSETSPRFVNGVLGSVIAARGVRV